MCVYVCVCTHTQFCLILCNPIDCSPPGSSVHGIFQARILEWVAISYTGDFPNPGIKSEPCISRIKPRSPALQVHSLPSEPLGKPKNTGVGSPSLVQGIFLTQELNWDFLHCRRILYQLSYQGSPWEALPIFKELCRLEHKIPDTKWQWADWPFLLCLLSLSLFFFFGEILVPGPGIAPGSRQWKPSRNSWSTSK